MEPTLELNRLVHIVAGSIGLAAFWIPIFATKGGRLHRRAGQVFRWSAIVVLTAAGFAVVGNVIDALLRGARFSDSPEGWAFLLFLGYLALVTGVILSHGFAVLRHKQDPTAMDTPYRRLSAWAAILSSAFIVAWALYWRPDNMILLLVLSPLGIGNVELADGRWVNGFVCEGYGFEGARDVTEFGGWRAFVAGKDGVR